MKKIILFSAVACSMAFFACKKDSNSDSTTPDTGNVKDSIDPVALSAAVKIGFATSATGDIPAATADGPTLLIDGYNNRTYTAISNRYVVIYPQSDKGFVAGYYVKINGANTYFKVDYKAAAGARKLQKSHGLREEGDNSDSSIVIKLPAGLKGDTFSIKYAAYDTLNHVGNAITAIVSIIGANDSTDNKAIYGTWRYNRYKYNYNDWSEPQKYTPDTSYNNYACIDNTLQECGDGYSCDLYPWRIYTQTANDNVFAANNAFTSVYNYTDDRIDEGTSTCSQLDWSYHYGRSRSEMGGYTYNATTKVLTFIYDENGADGGSNIYTDQYTLVELTATKMILSQKFEGGDRKSARDTDLTIYYREYIKQ